MHKLDKKIKAGLPICKLHKYGADYYYIKDGWLECQTCHRYLKSVTDDNDSFKIQPIKGIINYIKYDSIVSNYSSS